MKLFNKLFNFFFGHFIAALSTRIAHSGNTFLLGSLLFFAEESGLFLGAVTLLSLVNARGPLTNSTSALNSASLCWVFETIPLKSEKKFCDPHMWNFRGLIITVKLRIQVFFFMTLINNYFIYKWCLVHDKQY